MLEADEGDASAHERAGERARAPTRAAPLTSPGASPRSGALSDERRILLVVCSVCGAALTLSSYFLSSRGGVRFCMEHEPMDAMRARREADNARALKLWGPAPKPVVSRPARDETGRVRHG